jgi:hypothetical protein
MRPACRKKQGNQEISMKVLLETLLPVSGPALARDGAHDAPASFPSAPAPRPCAGGFTGSSLGMHGRAEAGK